MAGLLLGPLLRYVDEDTATVWVETDGPCEAEVRCDVLTGAGGGARTWQVGGHHYALVTVVGLEPGSETPYRVLLDGEQVWPLAESAFPPSTIRTLVPDGKGTLDLTFGSCRWAARPAGSRHDPVGPDALDALALRALAGADRPDVLVLLGDQVYADETSEALSDRLGRGRDLSEPPHAQVANYEEYTALYHESWLDPEVRWLLSTVPSYMIFDDHDLIDDWNTSAAWQQDIRREPWWRDRVEGGLASYWVYQHLGNLSPGELADDPLFGAVRSVTDGTEFVRKFAAQADEDLSSVRWSFRRDFGRVRLVMVDSRSARVLGEEGRAMVDDDEWQWLRRQILDDRGAYDHLLIGTSLPWLLPHAIHDTEAWDAALCAGARGERWARIGEKLRRTGDLEHWAAFPDSFHDMARLVEDAGNGAEAPATICVLSGDVHHAYVAEPRFDRPTDAHVLQLTCSPLHNSVPALMRLGFRLGWSRLGKWIGRMLIRHARIDRAPITWRRTGGPWFGNQLMTLTLRGRSARLRMDRARRSKDGELLGQVLDRVLGRGA